LFNLSGSVSSCPFKFSILTILGSKNLLEKVLAAAFAFTATAFLANAFAGHSNPPLITLLYIPVFINLLVAENKKIKRVVR
jgi:hypothetical protein